MAAHSGHSGRRLVLPHEATTKYRRHAARRLGDGWANVWLGTTTENQIEATRRIPHLVAIPAAVRFLSVEPMLEAIDLSPWLGDLDWMIVGGESGVGNRSRPMYPDWVRNLRDQVRAAGGAFFLKQVGSNRAL